MNSNLLSPAQLEQKPDKEINNSRKIFRVLLTFFLIVSFIGVLDAGFLTFEHYSGYVPPCSFLKGCEAVTTSAYSVVFGVPVALLGLIYYLVVFLLSVYGIDSLLKDENEVHVRKAVKICLFIGKVTIVGLLATLWFLSAQIFIIKAICLYCLISAVTSITLFVLGVITRKRRTLLSSF